MVVLAAGVALAFGGRDGKAADADAIGGAAAKLCAAAGAMPATVAVGGILDASSKVTEFSIYAADKLTEALVSQGRTLRFAVVERAALSELAREWALGQSGLVDEQTAAAAGTLSGARAFVFGSYARESAQRAWLTLRLVACEGGQVVASVRTSGELSREMAVLLDKPVVAATPAAAPASGGDSLGVKVWTSKESYRVGEHMQVSFQATHDCYVTLIDINPNGAATIVFPNAFHRDNAVRGGRVYAIPDDNMAFEFTIEPPAGVELIRVVASRAPVESVADVLSAIGEQNPFAAVADPAVLTRGIRVEGRKARPGTWAETVTRFAIEK
jgi:hypothetical protein